MKKLKPSEVKTSNIDGLVEAFQGDTDLLLFYVSWIKNGLNAQAAYKELHPDVTDGSAAVLGSRLLKKVNQEVILSAYGLDIEVYLKQLKEGMAATKWNDFTGERESDHKVRLSYHDKLGKLLGVEHDAGLLIQQNFNKTDIQIEIIEEKNG